jgi:uncharacterized protein (TIGR02001 family)
MLKKSLFVMLLCLAPFSAFSSTNFSGAIGLGSDYVWRGASQNNGNPALSAGLEYSNNGFYAGAWASQVDYNDDANVEYDFYGGYSTSLTDLVSIDVGLIQYNFDGDDNTSVEEVYVGGTLGIMSVTYYRDLDNSDNEFVSVAVDVMSKEGWNLALEHGETINGADYQALNISKDFGKVNLLAHLGSEESVIGLAYNF